jgi:hypothetical protein
MSGEEMRIRAPYACVLFASGGCTGWNKYEFLAGRRVSLLFQQQENTAIIKEWIKKLQKQLLESAYNAHGIKTEGKTILLNAWIEFAGNRN